LIARGNLLILYQQEKVSNMGMEKHMTQTYDLPKRLRPFQKEACNAAVKALQRGLRRILVVLPTGAGKTFTTVKLLQGLFTAYQNAGRSYKILWVAHREELVNQAYEAFKEVAPEIKATKWMSTSKDATGDIVIAMVGSTRTLHEHFDTVVVDEAHHLAEENQEEGYLGNMYTKLLKRITWSHLIGLTATPTRLDGKQLDFEEVVYAIRFYDLVRMGRLSHPIYTEVLTEQNYSLAVQKGDYTRKTLRRLNNPKRNKKIIDIWIKNRDLYGKTLMFVSDVQHCYDMYEQFKKADPNIQVAVLVGSNKKGYRKDVIEWFNDGDPLDQKVLINCEVFVEGFDAPSCRTVVLARPTMSKGLWLQMVGRGARVVEKNFFLYETQFTQGDAIGAEGMTDGVFTFKFANGTEYRAEDMGVVKEDEHGKLHCIRVQLENEFHLVNVMDDITKFASLCQEWQLEIREKTQEEIEELEDTKMLRRKQKSIQFLRDEGKIGPGGDAGTLGDEVIRDAIGILTISTYYHREMGFVIDEDRRNAVHRLDEYTKQCYTMVEKEVPVFDPSNPKIATIKKETGWEFDKDKYALAYTYCCVKGEFPYKFFERIRVAWYFATVLSKRYVQNVSDKQSYKTWEYYPIVDMTAKSREHAVAQAKKDMEEAEELNREFNEQYADRNKAAKLLQDIYKRAREIAQGVDDGKKRKALVYGLKVVINSLSLARAIDRRLVLMSSEIVDSWYKMSRNGKARDVLSEAFQDVMDDPNCIVTITPRAVTIDRKGSKIGDADANQAVAK